MTVLHIEHLNNGTGGYDINLLINRTDDLSEVPDTDIVVYVNVTNIFNNDVWIVGEYIGMVNDLMKYNIHISTDYNISKDHYLNTTNLSSVMGIGDQQIPLTASLSVLLLVAPEHITSSNAMITDIASGIDVTYASYVPTIKQKLTVVFGELVPKIFNKVDILYSGLEYNTWATTEYATYSNDVYELDDDGVPVYTVVDDVVTLNKLHSVGDNILDSNNEPIVLHTVGDVITDSQGNPTINKNREIVYLIDMVHIDAKLDHSEDTEHIDYVNNISTTLMSYFDSVNSVNDELIENTQIYFKPLRSLGKAYFKQSDDTTIELPLEITMAFKMYVDDYVKADSDMTNLIESTTLSIIDEHIESGTISMTAIVEDITNTMSIDIKYIDILGINGDNTLQTLISVDEDVRPNLKQELFLNIILRFHQCYDLHLHRVHLIHHHLLSLYLSIQKDKQH